VRAGEAVWIAAETAMLRRDGFQMAAREELTNGGAPGLSIVEQFRSPQAARDALAFEVSQSKASGGYTPFQVSGIPGAAGFSLGGSGIDIAFRDGPYYYLVGEIGGGESAIAGLVAGAASVSPGPRLVATVLVHASESALASSRRQEGR
jgi:hypothetical protein